METSNNFTCLSYDTVDFLIQSKYVLFGIYIGLKNEEKHINFEKELLPHINISHFLENRFSCRHVEDCNVMLVMQKDDFDIDLQKMIVDFTDTKFPASGNFAISVNSTVTSRIMDISLLRLIPRGIRLRQNECGICAIGFIQDSKNSLIQRNQILISPDNLLRKFIRSEK